MKLSELKLREIIKEELGLFLSEAKLKDFIKSDKLPSTVPAGSLGRVLADNKELRDQARNSASPYGQQQAFRQIGKLLAQDRDIRMFIKGDPIENHLDVKGFLRYAEENMPHVFMDSEELKK